MYLSYYLRSYAAFAICIALTSQGAIAQEHSTRITEPDHEVVVRQFVQWNSQCKVTRIPEIYVDRPPENGFVCFRRAPVAPGKVVIGPANWTHCFGRPMDGIHLVYFPREKFQ